MSILLTEVSGELLGIFDGAARVAVLTDISLMCDVTLLGNAREILPQFIKERG